MDDCPACHNLAALQTSLRFEDITGNRALFMVEWLACNHCDLLLKGQAKLEVIGLEPIKEVNLDHKSVFAREAQLYIKYRDRYAEEARRLREERDSLATMLSDPGD